MNLPDALRKWGVTVVEVDGWQTRGWLAGFGGVWNPRGVVCHHTANGGFRGVDAPSLNVCVYGRSDLAGPLCQIVLGYSGTAYVIAGRGANHAGKGGWNGLSGNASVWGIEAENNGVGEPWPDVQLDAYHRCVAALCELSGFGPEMVCGHKEWTAQKIDPAGIDMNGFRSTVAGLLAATPAPQPSKEDDPASPTTPTEVEMEYTLLRHEQTGAMYLGLGPADKPPFLLKHLTSPATVVEARKLYAPRELGDQGFLIDLLTAG